MDFKRIDQKTVQCILTEEDMNEYGFEIEDFFTNQEKSREFLEQIVERAEEEVGYKVESGMVSMQLMRMPDNSLTITFSEKPEDGIQGMLQHIQNLAGMIDEKSEESKSLEKKEKKVEKSASFAKKKEEYKKQQLKQQMQEMNAPKVFGFADFSDLELLAESFSNPEKISSSLYQNEKTRTYYLLVKKGKLNQRTYLSVCQRITEFGKFCSQEYSVEEYCREHFNCVIEKNALKVISSL